MVANFNRYVTLNSTLQLQMKENVTANSRSCNFDLCANVSYFTLKVVAKMFHFHLLHTMYKLSGPSAGQEGIELGYTSTL
jgi:hypothetical protein